MLANGRKIVKMGPFILVWRNVRWLLPFSKNCKFFILGIYTHIFFFISCAHFVSHLYTQGKTTVVLKSCCFLSLFLYIYTYIFILNEWKIQSGHAKNHQKNNKRSKIAIPYRFKMQMLEAVCKLNKFEYF